MGRARAFSYALALGALGGCAAPRTAEPARAREGDASAKSSGTGHVDADAQAPAARRVTLGGQTNGRLDASVIQSILRANLPRFRACYEGGVKRHPSLHGRVVTGFVIQRDGSVLAESVADAGSTLSDKEVIACVQGVFVTLTFPRPEGGLVTVVYPLTFDQRP